MKTRIALLPLMQLALLCMSSTAMAQTYDLVINNGRVMDPETMYDDIANVGVNDGRIATITKDKITGKETIDAEGLVLAPGCVDTHFHSVDPLIPRDQRRIYLRGPTRE